MSRRRRRRHVPPNLLPDVLLSQSANALKAATKRGTKHGDFALLPISSQDHDDIPEPEDILHIEKNMSTPPSQAAPPTEFNVFPFDFWLVLGDHIHPSSVSAFARTCTAAYSVTRTVRFWTRMQRDYVDRCVCKYQMYCSCPTKQLPLRGMRAQVVRSLPTPPRTHQPADPHALKNQQCALFRRARVAMTATSSPRDRTYAYIFKFKKLSSFAEFKLNKRRKKEVTKDNWFEDSDHEDELSIDESVSDQIAYNPDAAFSFLVIYSSHPVPVPAAVLGSKLTDVHVTSTGDAFQFQKVSLDFSPRHVRVGGKSAGSCHVTLDRVKGMSVVNWWQQRFVDLADPLGKKK